MYTAKEINEFQKTDRRISWLSIFSSLCGLYQVVTGTDPKELAKMAYELNDELNAKYPMDEPEPFPTEHKWKDPVIKNCPACGAPMKFVEAGISKKTGRHYNAFWSCPSCKKTSNG